MNSDDKTPEEMNLPELFAELAKYGTGHVICATAGILFLLAAGTALGVWLLHKLS